MDGIRCKCNKPLVLTKDTYCIKSNSKNYKFKNFIFLKCSECNKKYVPCISQEICKKIIKETPEETEFNFDFIKEKLLYDKFISCKVAFLYDKDDYYFIPGLIRPWNTGFLTPVFFNMEVLLKYIHHPNYSIELGAESYGNIYMNNQLLISFGINSDFKVIMWLGDIEKLDLNEQFYLRSENIFSNHNIDSEFYKGQIENQWAEPSNEKKLFKKRLELYELIANNYEFKISQLQEETIKLASKIIRPVVSSEEAFSNVIIPLNMLFVESINTSEIKKFLKLRLGENLYKDGLNKNEFAKFGSNKVFQIWLEKFLNIEDVNNLVSPLFILYDLRIAMAHLQSEEKTNELISFSCERLNLDKDERDYIKIYDKLIDRLNSMYDKIINFINKGEKKV